MSSIVLFGAGSPILGDVEETCLRLGLSVAAIVRNIGSATQQDTIGPTISLEELTPRLLALPMAFPLFSPATRRFAWSHASALGAARFDPLIDPTAILPSRMTVEEGVYINSGAVFGAFSRLGRAVFINRAAVIGHHVELDEFVSVGPGAKIGSNVRVGRGTVLGGGAYLDGERGPGVFRPAGTGVIEPAGVGAGVTVNVRVDGGAPGLLRSEAQIAQMLARAVSLGARRL